MPRATAAERGPTIQPRAYDAVRARKVASAGLAPDADTPLAADLVEWADIIFVMEKAHRTKLASKFNNSLNGQRVVCLHVPDRYKLWSPLWSACSLNACRSSWARRVPSNMAVDADVLSAGFRQPTTVRRSLLR